jgi:carbamoyl-phosphate synthase small subunit
MKTLLALENGTVFEGKSFGAITESAGEIVFNTSMSGYQEILTDPSYNGQTVCLTYPEIGNYGISPEDIESSKVQISGLIVKNCCEYPSNFRGEAIKLSDYLKENNIPGIQGIDTRKLVRILRDSGAMRGVIVSGDMSHEDAVSEAQAIPSIEGADLAKVVTTRDTYKWTEEAHPLQAKTKVFENFKLVAVDFGVKYNTLRRLKSLGASEIIVVSATATAQEILDLNPDGVYLSNGPGDPEPIFYAQEMIKQLVGQVPIFGICLGHQLLSLALGAKTFKLKFGHRGANHPIKNMLTNQIEITSQNHGFAVSPDNFPKDIAEVTHINLNDGTIAGIQHKTEPVFSVQYHPEASPGPHDSYYLFEKFAENIRKFRLSKVSV